MKSTGTSSVIIWHFNTFKSRPTLNLCKLLQASLVTELIKLTTAWQNISVTQYWYSRITCGELIKPEIQMQNFNMAEYNPNFPQGIGLPIPISMYNQQFLHLNHGEDLSKLTAKLDPQQFHTLTNVSHGEDLSKVSAKSESSVQHYSQVTDLSKYSAKFDPSLQYYYPQVTVDTGLVSKLTSKLDSQQYHFLSHGEELSKLTGKLDPQIFQHYPVNLQGEDLSKITAKLDPPIQHYATDLQGEDLSKITAKLDPPPLSPHSPQDYHGEDLTKLTTKYDGKYDMSNGLKPHKCEICGRSFTQRGGLNQHLLIHSGDKPYTCDICGKKFTQSGNLKSHKVIHTGIIINIL